jgi:restriction endonuclease S subunit
MQEIKFRWIANEVDSRNSAELNYPLMSVSQTKGVIPRSELMGNDGRAESLDNYKVCLPGQIVINRMSAASGALGLANQAGLVSPDYAVLAPTNFVEAKYLEYLMSSKWFIGEIYSRLKGIGAGGESASVRTPRINISDLGDVKVSLPSKEQQSKISQYLDGQVFAIDRVISLRQQQIELEAQLLKDSRRNLLTKISLDTENWRATRIGWSCQVRFGEPFESEFFMTEGELPLIRMGDLGATEFRFYVDPSIAPISCIVNNGDVLVGMSGQFQVEVWNRGTAALNQRLVAINSNFSQIILAAVIKPQLDEINALLPRTTLRNISAEQIRSLKFFIPKMDHVVPRVELEIKDFETRYTESVGILGKAIESLRELRETLITEAVTGSFVHSVGRD